MEKSMRLKNGGSVLLKLEENKKGFIISCKGLDGKGISCDDYVSIRKAAMEIATTHPNWPTGMPPDDGVIWDSNDDTFTVKPISKQSAA